jgi:hypothetical protein
MYVSLLHIYHKDARLLLLMLEIKGWFQTKKKAVDVQRSFSHADIYMNQNGWHLILHCMIVYSYEYIGGASLVSIELHIAHGSLMVMVNRCSIS